MILETVVVGPYQANCYVLAKAPSGACILIDPGDAEKKIRHVLKKHSLDPSIIVNTHGHIDHIGCDDAFGVPVYVHKQDLPLLRQPELNLSNLLSDGFSVHAEIIAVEEGARISAAGLTLEVLHVPGHTPGGMALVLADGDSRILFTGDSLFNMSIGRSDFPGGNAGLLVSSIRAKILSLPGNTVIYPGHGPSTTVAEEKQHNPFLNENA